MQQPDWDAPLGVCGHMDQKSKEEKTVEFLKELWRKWGKPDEAGDGAADEKPVPQGPSMSQWHTFGESIVFTNREKGVTRTIVGDRGRICNFPGIDAQVPACYAKEAARVRYRTDFERRADGKILMIWEIQPDGRYWADEDGFGGTNDEEVRLYSVIDEEGRFLHPFRLYNCGTSEYYSWKMEDGPGE